VTFWVDTLVTAAESRWMGGKPLYLAQVPPLLREKSIDINDVRAGRSLRTAIATDASDRLRLVVDPDHSLPRAPATTLRPIRIS
jgi:hypothetical protein